MSQRPRTIEQTSKAWKAVQAVGVAISILGVIWGARNLGRPEAVNGFTVMFFGIAVYLAGRALAWWNNG